MKETNWSLYYITPEVEVEHTYTHRDIHTHPQLVSRRLSPTCRDAMPKSAMRMLFFSSRSRFSGFRSLWLRQDGGAQASGLFPESEDQPPTPPPLNVSQRGIVSGNF